MNTIRSFPHHGQSQTHKCKNCVFYSVSHFSDEGLNSYLRLHSWTNLLESKILANFESLFQELPSAFLEWANRKGKATPWLQYSTAAFRIEDHFQGICSSLREPLWDTLISYGVMRCKSTRYYSDPQMNFAIRTRNPDSSGQRGRQVLNPLRSNCYLLPHK